MKYRIRRHTEQTHRFHPLTERTFFSSIQLSAAGEKAEFPQPPVVSDTHICGSGSSSFTVSIGMDSLSVHAAGNHTDC